MLILILFLCFIEGHKFISFFITVTCLPPLNKGVTLPYQGCVAPISKLKSHISDRCSDFTG